MNSVERIPFRVDISRIVELLARQIYQSPLALLRENCQNAYDAILQRIHSGEQFEPQIFVTLTPTEIIVEDNGIGMTKLELMNNYWRAGASGKNTPEARAAGVVGTFGIGAMANFGIASELQVLTESTKTGERTRCLAARETLSATDDCIQLVPENTTGTPGTVVTAVMAKGTKIDISAAVTYLKECVRHLTVPVVVNGKLVSQEAFESDVQRPLAGTIGRLLENVPVGGQLTAWIEILGGRTGEIWVGLTNIREAAQPVDGVLLLKQGTHQIRSYRSRFALAQGAVSSHYNFGGIANLAALQPTAGREALTTESLQLLQTIVTETERHVSIAIADTDLANQNTGFLEWAYHHNRLDLCSQLQVRLEPDNRSMSLLDVRRRSAGQPFNYYEGSDQTLINQLATEDQPLIVVSTRQPRRKCELGYLRQFCKVRSVVDKPTVLSRKADRELTLAELTLALRTVGILESDYFVPARVQFGKISHGVTIYTDTAISPVEIILDSEGATISTILKLYENDFLSMTGLVKDFVRNAVFPKIAHLVPSSTRQGAEAFLRAIRKPRDVFEYEKGDLGSLNDIWAGYLEGKISFAEAARQSAVAVRTSVQIVDRSATRPVASVLADVLENEQLLTDPAGQTENNALQALPAITRLDKESVAKLLLIDEEEPALKGYRCFLAITDRVRRDRGEFFLQPHRTEIVWGGQKALYIFQHHSGEFGLYYELQGTDVLASAPGGQEFPTCTIVVKNQVYIPIPDEIKEKFIPSGSGKKSFEIRCELLYPETGTA